MKLEQWHLGANDPDVIGWITVAAYACAACLCWLCARAAGNGADSAAVARRRFWWVVTGLLLVLGVNKQLDLQTPMIAIGRDLVVASAGSREWQRVKWWVVAGLGAAGCAGFAVLAWRVRCIWRELWWALAGMVALLVFVVARAAPGRSIERVWPVMHAVSGKRHMVELAGILFISVAAIVQRRREGRGGIQ